MAATAEQAPTVADICAGANLSEISRRTGIHLSHISRVMSGKRSVSTRNLSALAAFLGVPMDELYTYLRSIQQDSILNKR
jgi:transcriptional regulator with XRE-family HTH domain